MRIAQFSGTPWQSVSAGELRRFAIRRRQRPALARLGRHFCLERRASAGLFILHDGGGRALLMAWRAAACQRVFGRRRQSTDERGWCCLLLPIPDRFQRTSKNESEEHAREQSLTRLLNLPPCGQPGDRRAHTSRRASLAGFLHRTVWSGHMRSRVASFRFHRRR